MLNINAASIVAKRKAVVARQYAELRSELELPEPERKQRRNDKIERAVQETMTAIPAMLDAAAEQGIAAVLVYSLEPGFVWGYNYCPERALEEDRREFQRDVLAALEKQLKVEPGIICFVWETGQVNFRGRNLMVAAKV